MIIFFITGVFSISDNNLARMSEMLPQEFEKLTPQERINCLGSQVITLEAKVADLEGQLEEKQRISVALEEDVSNLKKEVRFANYIIPAFLNRFIRKQIRTDL